MRAHTCSARLLVASLYLAALSLLSPAPAAAQSIASRSERTLFPGITLATIRTSDPATDVRAAFIDLCNDYIHVDATATASSLRSTGSWASSRGVQLATNGDFYRTGPVRVYGDAVGNGTRWPSIQTGLHDDYASEWYYRDYGWIAFGPDFVEVKHSGWVRNNMRDELREGWDIASPEPAPPAGTRSLVSGFPELVVEGRPRTCANPASSSCFPERSDMADRHPRTAMGLSADRQTFILVTVDGRSSRSAGMRGGELAWLMGELGAYHAFNLDGGGSTQMWADGSGYLNTPSESYRSVANHWGVFAGSGSGRPRAPGHCMDDYEPPPCAVVGASGTTVLQETGPCFQSFGDLRYWRTVEGAGHGGSLLWTNAFAADSPNNWARWNMHFEEAGRYRVEAYLDPTWSVYPATRYRVRAEGVNHEVIVDQGAARGWTLLAEMDFAAGGDQRVAVYDNYTGSVPADQHIAVDSIRITRVACDPETCNGEDDDCDGVVPLDERDVDGDGWSTCEGDSDDGDPDVYPGAPGGDPDMGPGPDVGGGEPDMGLDLGGGSDLGSAPDLGTSPDLASGPDVGSRADLGADAASDVPRLDWGGGADARDDLGGGDEGGDGVPSLDAGAGEERNSVPRFSEQVDVAGGCAVSPAAGARSPAPWLLLALLGLGARRRYKKASSSIGVSAKAPGATDSPRP